MSDGPIFLGGLDHSGKTLLRLALSAHPNIALTRRTHMWTDFYNRYGNLNDSANFERCLQAMLNKKAVSVLSPDKERIKREFLLGEPSYARLFELIHRHFAEKHGRKRWGEQEALIEQFADLIFQAYPTARMIHLIRDPRAQYEAIVRTTNVRVRLGKVGARCNAWQYSVQLAHRNQITHANNYLVVTYERLMADPLHTLQRVCEFIGEDYVPAMQTFEGTIRFSAGKEADALPSQGWPDPRVDHTFSASDILTAREIRFIETALHNEMTKNGYNKIHTPLAMVDRLLYYAELPFNLARFGCMAKPGS